MLVLCQGVLDILCQIIVIGQIVCLRNRYLRNSYLRNRGCRNDRNIVNTVALHITDQGFSHLQRIFPTVFRVGVTSLEDDLRHLRIGIHGGRQRLSRGRALKGKLTVVISLVQDQTGRIDIDGGIQTAVSICDLRGCIGTAVAVGQRSVLQSIQRHKAQIANAVALIFANKNVARLQVGVQISAPTADSQSGAHIQAQIYGRQMGHGFPTETAIQTAAVVAEQIDIVTGVCFHRFGLPTFVGYETFQLGQLLQDLRFLDHTVSQLPEIFLGSFRGGKSAGQQQGLQTPLGSGNGNDLDYVFAVRIFLHGGTAFNTVMLTDGLTHNKLIQKGGDQFRL